MLVVWTVWMCLRSLPRRGSVLTISSQVRSVGSGGIFRTLTLARSSAVKYLSLTEESRRALEAILLTPFLLSGRLHAAIRYLGTAPRRAVSSFQRVAALSLNWRNCASCLALLGRWSRLVCWKGRLFQLGLSPSSKGPTTGPTNIPTGQKSF